MAAGLAGGVGVAAAILLLLSLVRRACRAKSFRRFEDEASGSTRGPRKDQRKEGVEMDGVAGGHRGPAADEMEADDVGRSSRDPLV